MLTKYSQALHYNPLESKNKWYFTGEATYKHHDRQKCLLCEERRSKYLYTIKNKINGDVLHVDEKCLKKLSLPSQPYKIDNPILRNKDINIIKVHLHNLFIEKLLRDLLEINKVRAFRLCLERFSKNRNLTPSQAVMIIRELKSDSISIPSRFLRVRLKTDNDKYEVALMSTKDLSIIYKHLTTNQREKARIIRYNMMSTRRDRHLHFF